MRDVYAFMSLRHELRQDDIHVDDYADDER